MSREMDRRSIFQVRLAARAVTAAAGLALLVAPFLAWTSLSLQQLALLAVTTNGTLGRLSLSRTGWEASAGTAAALSGLALIVVATAVLDRLPLILPAGLICLAALVVVTVQAGSPPSALPGGHLGAGLPSSGVSPHSSAGAGETMAIAALVAAGLGMWGMLAAAHSERRRRRRSQGAQRAAGSTVRPPTAAVSAGEPADGAA
jgi:hypothetical protein